MTAFFVDTSALVKRTVKEPGSAWVLSWIEPPAGNVIIVSELTIVEINSVFARRLRDGSLTAANVHVLKGDFGLHMKNEYIPALIDTTLLHTAASLTDKYPLRALDAIQLASALDAVASLNIQITFISGDNNLLAAASAEGFAIDNPYQHP